MLAAQHNMGGFMKGILVKRLESSFYAFSKTLDRFAESYTKFIAMAKSGKVYISKKDNDKYDLLITTDVLAEGINLHRANVLVNYDLPWNPTRIMQRVGRINRVGTEHDRMPALRLAASISCAMPIQRGILLLFEWIQSAK